MATDTWDTTAVPILEAIAEHEGSERGMVDVADICDHMGVPVDERGRAVSIELDRLIQAGYVGGKKDGTMEGPAHDSIVNPHLLEAGARAVGRWPSQDPYEALLQRLEREANETTDPDRKAALKKMAGTVGEVGQGVLTGVLTALVRGAAGLA